MAFITPFLPRRIAADRKVRKGEVRPLHVGNTGYIEMCAAAKGDGLTYAASGVDIDAEAASIQALVKALGPPGRPVGTMGGLVDGSGFSGLIEFGDKYLAMCTDGVGSKLQVAEELKYYETVGIDCMAMNVNDLLCIGAEPLSFVDYIAAPKPNVDVWRQLGKGLGEGCRRAKVSLAGGESASLGGIVNGVDLSGTALGWVGKGEELRGRVEEGDVVIGLASSGVHSNGFSLVRKVAKGCLEDVVEFEVEREIERIGAGEGEIRLGEVLMNPTRIYVEPVVEMLQRFGKRIHAIVHVTGGGLSNLLRIGKGWGVVLEDGLKVWKEFEWMQERGNISDWEMYRTFNMGIGLCVVVEKSEAEAVEKWLQQRENGCKRIGYVDKSGRVEYKPLGLIYTTY